MGVIIDPDGSNRLSWIEYQVLMLVLTGAICTVLFLVEIALSRFQVLPLLFPGMFSLRERRFYFFSFDISDGHIGKSVRSEAKKAVRMTIFLVLSYLWQHCVLETTQSVGTAFPTKECNDGYDCYTSDLHFSTLFNREPKLVDCSRKQAFDKRVVVSCIQFVRPTATKWLMHLAIAHSVTQLNFKAFELVIWVGGNSKWCQRFIGLLILLSFASFGILWGFGFLAEFISSWLSFVMALTIPLFLYTALVNCRNLERLWSADAVKVQKQSEEQLNRALADIETTVNHHANFSEASTRRTSKSIDPTFDLDMGAQSTWSRSRGNPMQVMSSIKNAISNTVRIRRSVEEIEREMAIEAIEQPGHAALQATDPMQRRGS